jgi:hypothetical protein
MFFFNDEFDLADDDQYDLFTLACDMERHRAGQRERRAIPRLKTEQPKAISRSRLSNPGIV